MFRTLSTAVLLLLFALPGVAFAQGTGTIAGRVLESDGVTSVIGATVRVEGTNLGAQTNIDGDYRIIGVPVGEYTITASFVGLTTQTQNAVTVNAGYTRQLNFTLGNEAQSVGEAVVTYVNPLISPDAIGAPRVVTGEDLENLPIRGVASTVALQGGIVNTEGTSDLNIRGGRSEEVAYYVDGVRITGSLLGVNQQAIEQQEVLIGTIPARYGDVQSGVISITTKTGRDDFFGSLEGVTSTGLDSYGYNLASLSLGGPIVPGRVGFFLSAEGQDIQDANPYGLDTYRLSDQAYSDLQANPQMLSITLADKSTQLIPFPYQLLQGEMPVSRDSLQKVLLANNTIPQGSKITSGIPVNTADTFTADQFESVAGKDDPLKSLTLNGNLNFTFGDIGLRVGGNYATRNRNEYSFRNSLYSRDDFYNRDQNSGRAYATLRQRLSNSAFYQIQGEYQDFHSVTYPQGFSDNVRDVLSYGDITNANNEIAARYFTYDGTGNQYNQTYQNANVSAGRVVPGTFNRPGGGSLTGYSKSRNQQIRFSGSATGQVGIHQIEFGGEFQQETQRLFTIDSGDLLAQYLRGGDGVVAVGDSAQGISQYTSLGYTELLPLTTGVALYGGNRYGYDLYGLNEVNDQNLEGYFDRSNTNIAPYKPVYYAGYIQDKIELQDLVIQLGLRVDVFDNNTEVLKDIYSPLPIVRADALASVPSNIQSDWAVYFVGGNSETGAVVGYRDLDGNFYNSSGSPSTSEAVQTGLRGQVDPTSEKVNASVFEPYKAQATFMPRVGVSFPVTDRALFFASFNVTSQRPTERAFAPISFYENIQPGQTSRFPNARLEPERTTQYEIGFRQRVSERAAVSLSGFYRTQENKISNRNLIGSFPSYGTYLNADFTTTQGAEVNFDLRRTNNLQVNANYTLSFAQGTGSDAAATATVVWRGNYFPQFINPADFDQRHTVNVTLDYRFGKGDGPMFGGIHALENFGINLIGQFGSGQRYTRLLPQGTDGKIYNVTQPQTTDVAGTINGGQLPATTRLDLRVDRAFNLGFSDSRLRAYLQVQNLLNTRNRLSVYRATGQSNDDGYYDTQSGQNQLNTPGLLFNYEAYSAGPVNTGGSQSSSGSFFYSAPRQVKLGFLFDF